jgi:hypothetical protein
MTYLSVECILLTHQTPAQVGLGGGEPTDVLLKHFRPDLAPQLFLSLTSSRARPSVLRRMRIHAHVLFIMLLGCNAAASGTPNPRSTTFALSGLTSGAGIAQGTGCDNGAAAQTFQPLGQLT